MNRREFAKIAFDECTNYESTVRFGKKNSTPFWNVESKQFMFVPAFHFTGIPGCYRYRYDAKDESGNIYSFENSDCNALLSPVWSKLCEGVVCLTVTALNSDGTDYSIVGARTFFKLASFPEKTPKAKCSYIECAKKAYEFAMEQPFIKHWLEDGTPDPYYDLYIYPSKIISSLVEAMISYSRLYPECKEKAMHIAVSAADYLMKITPRGDGPLTNIPPTYYFDFCPDPEKYGIKTANYANALLYKDTVMMTYPASAGNMYVLLYRATGEQKYLKEAKNIAKFYIDNVKENGSWDLVVSCETGKPVSKNDVAPLQQVVPFLMELYKETGDERLVNISEKAVDYTVEKQLSNYNWEGQFEDTGTSSNYYNLSHYGPISLIEYYTKYNRDDKDKMRVAQELIRFVEDQFVVWNRFNPWHDATSNSLEANESVNPWISPAALEQYVWYVPIDASTAHVANAFLMMYEAGFGDIYLAKAKALADQITRAQHENGQIPTHWQNTEFAESNFWINCMFYSCSVLEKISKYDDVDFDFL